MEQRETVYIFADKENYFLHNGRLRAIEKNLDKIVERAAGLSDKIEIEVGKLPPQLAVDAKSADLRLLNCWEMEQFKDYMNNFFGGYKISKERDFADEEFASRTSLTATLASIFNIYR